MSHILECNCAALNAKNTEAGVHVCSRCPAERLIFGAPTPRPMTFRQSIEHWSEEAMRGRITGVPGHLGTPAYPAVAVPGPVGSSASASIAGTPSTMLGEALVHLQRAHDLTMQAHAKVGGIYSDVYFETQVAKAREFIQVLKRAAAEVRDSALSSAKDKAPPDACWLCSKPLGTHPECLMCSLKRLEDAK